MVRLVVSHHGGTPVYRQIATILRGRISQGTLAPGENLPAELDLAAEFSVGRDSVREALALLRAEGLIETRRGFRSQVREPIVRTRIPLTAGKRLTARMPTPEERVEYDVPVGVPMLVIDEEPYPGDRFEAYTA